MTKVARETEEMDSLRAAIYEPVTLSAYQASWPVAFAKERERLFSALPGAFIAIEHIGSTAVEGMLAKPVIDVMAGVKSMLEAELFIEKISRLGYTTSAEFNATLVDRKWLMRFFEGHRTHHMHITVYGGAVWNERLCFRDTLRSDPRLEASYKSLKQQLAVVHETDREAYTDAKAQFIRSVISAA